MAIRLQTMSEEKNSEILARLEEMGFRTVAEDSGTLVLKRDVLTQG